MFIDKDSIIINGISIGQYSTQARFGYHKGWGKDTGRNTLSGAYSGTFLGIYPKITITMKPLNQKELEKLAPVFDSARQSVTYYDPNKKKKITMATYSGDWEFVCKNIGKTETFDIAFISVKKRG